MNDSWQIGDWCWHTRQAAPCRVVEHLALWGVDACRVWLPSKNTVLRSRAAELVSLYSVSSTVEQLLYATAAGQWQAEMRSHLGEPFHFVEPSSLAALHQWRSDSAEDNPWRMHDQVICALESVNGIWSLWEIGFAARGASRKRFLQVFINDEGRSFMPTAKRVWDLLLTETVSVQSVVDAENSARWFDVSFTVASTQGEPLFVALAEEHCARIKEERDRATYALGARYQAIGHIGLPAVHEFRRYRLQAGHEARLAAPDEMEAPVAELNAVAMARIGVKASKNSESAA